MGRQTSSSRQERTGATFMSMDGSLYGVTPVSSSLPQNQKQGVNSCLCLAPHERPVSSGARLGHTKIYATPRTRRRRASVKKPPRTRRRRASVKKPPRQAKYSPLGVRLFASIIKHQTSSIEESFASSGE